MPHRAGPADSLRVVSRGRGTFALLIAIAAVGAAAFAGGSTPATAGAPSFDSFTLAGQAPRAAAVPQKAAVTWCGGSAESATDRTPQVELSALEQMHVVYAIPSDGADAFAAYASPIASDAEAIDAWWRGQDASRSWRFDLYAFPGCTTRFGALDISVVRLPQASSFYGVDLGTRMQRLTTDMRNRFGPRMKMLVYYDGPVLEPNICGTAWSIPPDAPNELFGFGYVWLRSQCPNDLGTGGFIAVAAAHEMTHNFGPFFNPGAPHECAPPHDHHACDSQNDLMFWAGFPGTTLATQILDVGRDDYYGHTNPSLVDVQDSPWLTHFPQFPLTTAVSSQGGKGSVAMTQPATGFSCAASCTATLDNGRQIVLTGQPDKSSRLVRWEGACSGAGGCNLTMDGAKSATAVFGPAVFTLTVAVTGKGRVTSKPSGISCTSRCSHSYQGGKTVHLSAKASKGFRLTGWSGACHGTGACNLTLDQNRSTRATFKRKKQS